MKTLEVTITMEDQLEYRQDRYENGGLFRRCAVDRAIDRVDATVHSHAGATLIYFDGYKTMYYSPEMVELVAVLDEDSFEANPNIGSYLPYTFTLELEENATSDSAYNEETDTER